MSMYFIPSISVFAGALLFRRQTCSKSKSIDYLISFNGNGQQTNTFFLSFALGESTKQRKSHIRHNDF